MVSNHNPNPNPLFSTLDLGDEEEPLVYEVTSYTPPADPLAPYAQHSHTPAPAPDAPGMGPEGSLAASVSPDNSKGGKARGAGEGCASARDTLRLWCDVALSQQLIRSMSQHRNSLTLPCLGLACLRLLMREPLMKRGLLANFMEIDELDKVDVDEDESVIDDDFEREEASVHTRFTQWRAQTWEREHFREEETGRDMEHLGLTALLAYVGDNHLQSTEVAEQLLLLLDHLCRSSFVCRLSLMEAGMVKYADRVPGMYPSDLYLAALCGVVKDDMRDDTS